MTGKQRSSRRQMGERIKEHLRDEMDRSFQSFLTGPARQPVPDQGLRERKKRELRQRISDTATTMFRERGFDQVRVSDVAEACGVSEKTVFNYFPTKESLVFDREEEMAARIREAVRDRGPSVPLIDAVLEVMDQDLDAMAERWRESDLPDEAMLMFREFVDMVEGSPALLAWMNGMNARLIQVAASALAERVGVDPEDPEPQLAAVTLLGLMRVQFQARYRYTDGSMTIDEVMDSVKDDVRRAARVADSGLSAFNLVLHPSSIDQIRAAARTAESARAQMMKAVKRAREEWKEVVSEFRTAHQESAPTPEERREMQRQIRALKDEFRTRRRQEMRRLHGEMRRRRR